RRPARPRAPPRPRGLSPRGDGGLGPRAVAGGAVGGHLEAVRAAGLGGLAREELRLAEHGDDVEAMGSTVRRAEAHAPGVVDAAIGAEEHQVVEAEEALRLAERPFGSLHRERVGAPAAVAVEVDAALGKRA